MKECDIFRGSKHTLTPPTYFQAVRTPQPPRIYAADGLGVHAVFSSLPFVPIWA